MRFFASKDIVKSVKNDVFKRNEVLLHGTAG
jgi:hypothetical protein